MATTLDAQIQAMLGVTETTDAASSPASQSGGNQRVFNSYNLSTTLSATSKPPIDGEVIDLSLTPLPAVTNDIDLTAAPWAAKKSVNVSKSGKKLVALLIRAPSTNVGNIIIQPQGANKYNLFGAAGGTDRIHELLPGETLLQVMSGKETTGAFTNGKGVVGAGAKDIRVSGAVTDSVQILAVFGT